MDDEKDDLASRINNERRRELAIEHLLFGTIRFVEARHPGLVEELAASLTHLGDMAVGPDKDDDAVRDIARNFLRGVRRDPA